MAVIAPTIKALGGGAVLVEWIGAAGGDTCDWISLTEYRDKTVQMGGTLTAVALQGTNNPDKSAPVSLSDVDNTTVLTQGAFAAGAMKVLKENPLYIRPLVTTGTAVVVRLTGRR